MAAGAVAEVAHEAVELLLILHAAQLLQEGLELRAHLLELAALLVQPLQLLRPVFVEGDVAGVAEGAGAGSSDARSEKAWNCPFKLSAFGRSRRPR